MLLSVAGRKTIVAFGVLMCLSSMITRPGLLFADEPKRDDRPIKRAFDRSYPALAELHVFEIEVIDDETGDPLSDAQVQILENVDLKFHNFPTDPRGRLKVEYPVMDGSGASVEVRKDGYIPQRHSLDGSASGYLPDADFTVRLRRGNRIGGVVVDEGGHPIANARVVVTVSSYKELRSRPKLKKGFEMTYEVPVATDGEGRWRYGGVSPDAREITVQLIHPGFVSDNTTTLGQVRRRLPALAGLRDFTDRQVMFQGVLQEGRVLDSIGQPIVGADVVDSTKGLTFLPFIRRTATDAEGHFRFHFDETEALKLTVTAKGFAPVTMDSPAKRVREPLDVRLAPAKTIEGRVVDRAGRPVSATCVFLRSGGQHKGIFLRTWTDAQGRFHWDGAPDEAVSLCFTRAGYAESDVSIRPSDKETLIVLNIALDLRIKVVDAGTGKALKKYLVEIGTVPPAGEKAHWRERVNVESPEGEYRRQIDVSVLEHQFRVTAEDYDEFLSGPIPGGGGVVLFEIQMIKR